MEIDQLVDVKAVLCKAPVAVVQEMSVSDRAAKRAAVKAARSRRPLSRSAEGNTYEIDRILARAMYNGKDW